MDGELKSQLDLVLYFGEHHPAASATLLIGLDYSRATSRLLSVRDLHPGRVHRHHVLVQFLAQQVTLKTNNNHGMLK